ncbi:MAG: VOC family protein [Lachnospiraceae bacterium]|nr:VOC family protein [Lachnospiraceae bacterium]
MKFNEIFHLGVVVRDLDKAVKIYTEELGYGPFEIADGSFFDDKIINGEIGPGLPMKTATYRSDTYEIELIEPTGPSIYMDFLKEKGPGIHHVILKTDEKYADVLEMAQRVSGRPPKLETKFPNGIPIVAYVDLVDEAGLLIEIGGNN